MTMRKYDIILVNTKIWDSGNFFGGVTISIENVPEKYLDMTYDSEPRTI